MPGRRAATARATAAPMEWPTRWARSAPSASSTPVTASARMARVPPEPGPSEPVPTSLPDVPCPGRSSAYTRYRAAIGSCRKSQEFRSPPYPWMSRITSPSWPAPAKLIFRPPTSAVSGTASPAASSGTPASITARAWSAAASSSSSVTSAGAISAIVPLTGTSSPMRAIMRRTVPTSAASSVPAIFSVSMSARSSPTFTSSPSPMSQAVILPSCMDRPHFGIVTGTIRSSVTGSTR